MNALTCRRRKLRVILYVGVVLVAFIWAIALDLARAPPPELPETDFTVTNATTTPSAPSVGDMVIFTVTAQIVTSNIGWNQWVKVACLLDGQLWRTETLVFSNVAALEAFAQTPWRATSGFHIVTWVVDPDQQYQDPNLENNMVRYTFTVAASVDGFDFSVSGSPSLQSVTKGQSISFEVNVYMCRPEKQIVNLNMGQTDPGLKYAFSDASANSTYSSRLDVVYDSVTPGVYYLNLTADGETRSHSLTLTLYLQPPLRQSSSIFFLAVPKSVTLGENITIAGAISPPHNSAVTLRYTRPENLTFVVLLNSKPNGTFVYKFKPDAVGTWTFYANWTGDNDHLGAQGPSVKIVVQQRPAPPMAEFVNQLESTSIVVLNAVAVILIIALVVILLCGLIAAGM